MKPISQVIAEKYGTMTKGQRLLAAYVTEHCDKAAFKNSFELAGLAGVSQSTVVRFAIAVGYGGYTDFQNAMQDELKYRLSALERFELMSDTQSDGDLLEGIAARDAVNIKKSAALNKIEALKDLCTRLTLASQVYVYGQGQASAAAQYLSADLRVLLPNLCCINQTGIEPLAAASGIDNGDILVCISFPPHSEATRRLIAYAKEREAMVAVICEGTDAEVARKADVCLCSECGDYGMNGTLAPVISLCGTLVCILAKNDERAQQKLRRAGDAVSFVPREE